MESNPYAPPRAATIDVPAEAPTTVIDRVRKPVSAWLLQLLCAIFIVASLYGTGLLVAQVVGLAHPVWPAVVGGLVVYVGLLVWFGFAFVGTQRRAAHGRWLGLSVLGLMLLMCLVSLAKIAGGDDPLHADSAYQAGRILGACLWAIVVGWWTHAFGYSTPARQWFRIDPPPSARAEPRWPT